jgi:hypothetical protein
MIGGYCRVGVMAEGWVEIEDVDSSVYNIDYDNKGELMIATKKEWHGLEFEHSICGTLQDCAGYYVIICRPAVVIVRPDFTVHSNIYCNVYEIALFPLCQKAVYTDYASHMNEWNYITGSVRYDVYEFCHTVFLGVTCQRSGNVICGTRAGFKMLSSEYECFHYELIDDGVDWIGSDIWDQIVVISANRLLVFSADGKTEVFGCNLCACINYDDALVSATINMCDGTLCCLDDLHNRIIKYKNKNVVAL